jgi:xanthine/uracil permease
VRYEGEKLAGFKVQFRIQRVSLRRRYAEHVLRKLFPPIVTGTAIMLIGAGLTGTGIKYWWGFSFYFEHVESNPADP